MKDALGVVLSSPGLAVLDTEVVLDQLVERGIEGSVLFLGQGIVVGDARGEGERQENEGNEGLRRRPATRME